MATTINLTASRRTVLGKQSGALRRAGKLPAVLYGAGFESAAIELDTRETSRILNRLSGTHLIDLAVDGAVHKALVRHIQRDFIRGDLLHVDFYKVAMDRKIRVTVPINLVGTAPIEADGVVVHGLTEIDVECLPGDIISGINVDLAVLKAIGDTVHVRDLQVPSTVEVLTSGDELVARMTHQAAEEVAPVVATETVAEPEVIERGRKDEDDDEG